jgi:phosphonate transport system substrate-binding protein
MKVPSGKRKTAASRSRHTARGPQSRRPRSPSGADARILRCRTYLTPSIPKSLFAYLTAYLGQQLGVRTELQVVMTHSGPPPHLPDPFALGELDLAFCCAPAYIWLHDQATPTVDLVPFGLVFDDPRAAGRPVTFSDIVVRADHPARSFADLVSARWGFNDHESLSGYYSVLQTAVEYGADRTFMSRLHHTRGHLNSLRGLRQGTIDAAAIDSVVVALRWREDRALRTELRLVQSLGPWPIQPIIMRRSLPARVKARLATAMGKLASTPERREALRRWLIAGVAPMTDQDFDVERAALARAQALERALGGGTDTPHR